MNKIDYGHFYSFSNSKTNPTETYLVSHFTYVIKDLDITKLDAYTDKDNVGTFAPLAVGTGDKLCYGSFSQGIVNIIFYFSSKHILEKAIHYGLHGLVYYFIGFIISLLRLMKLIVMIKNLKIISGHVGGFIV